MLNTSLYWYSQGISVIPLIYRSKKPIVKWKRYQSELPTIDNLIQWFTGPKHNLALITTDNLVVLDFDNPVEFGYWFCYQSDNNPDIIDTYMVQSARGLHLYYWIEDDFEPVKSVESYEIKSHGRMINIPPSVHPTGIPYKAVNSPDKIKKVSSIEQILTFSVVRFEKPKIKITTDPWRILTTDYKSVERVDLLALFPDAKETNTEGYYLANCPFHGHRNNFMLNVIDGVGYCYTGCGTFLATELAELLK